MAEADVATGARWPCACCGRETLEEEPRGSYEICPVCGWEQDDVQEADPSSAGGANEASLDDARRAWRARSA